MEKKQENKTAQNFRNSLRNKIQKQHPKMFIPMPSFWSKCKDDYVKDEYTDSIDER